MSTDSDFTARFEAARKEAGLSWRDLDKAITPLVFRSVSDDTLRRLVLAGDPHKFDPLVLGACAKVLGVRLEELSPVHARFLADRYPYDGPERRKRSGRRDQRKSPSRWTPIYAGELAAAC